MCIIYDNIMKYLNCKLYKRISNNDKNDIDVIIKS